MLERHVDIQGQPIFLEDESELEDQADESEDVQEISIMTQTEKVKMVDKNTNMHNEVLPFVRSYVSHVNSPHDYSISTRYKNQEVYNLLIYLMQ